MFNIECNQVTIQHRPFASDIIRIEFTGENPFPELTTPPELIIHAKQNTGEDYCKKMFGVDSFKVVQPK